MKFVRVIEVYEHLWGVKELDKEFDELTSSFKKWNDVDQKISEVRDTFVDVDELKELIFRIFLYEKFG